MRAIVATPDGPVLDVVPTPAAGPGEALIRVRAVAMNRIDLRMSRGAVHGTSGGVGTPCGMEFAGEIVALGPGVTSWTVGQRVMGMGPHAFAELKVASATALLAIDDKLSFEEATTLPGALLTMHDALTARGELKPGESVLIQGASSGMGIAGMQIAKELGAALVIGTSTSAERRALLPRFGADLVLDSRSETWVEEVHSATAGKGVDVVFDMVAGATVTQSMRALRVGGRMVNIGRVGGEEGPFDFDLHSLKRITYVGTTFRTRSKEETDQALLAAMSALGAAVAEKRITMPIDSVYPWADALGAFDRMAKNEHFGKILISV